MAAPDESPPASLPADPPFPEIELGRNGRVDRADIPGLCERARILLTSETADQLVCDAGAIVTPDAVAVDALARLQLTARRSGRELRVRRASRELQDLVAFMGLGGVVPLSAGSGLEPGRQTEEREQRVRVKEKRDPADPAI